MFCTVFATRRGETDRASVSPRFRVGSRWGRREHVLDHEGQYSLGPISIILLHRVLGGAACIAVRHAGAVLKYCVGVGIVRGLKLLVEDVNCVIEKVGIGVADGDVDFAF